MEHFDPSGAKLQPLFITTDPAFDTKEILSSYIAAYNKNILALTGTKEQVEQAESGYKVYVSQPDHSTYIYLMSPDGKALEIMSATISAEEMIAKIKPRVTAAH
jgi:protein SCO1/2